MKLALAAALLLVAAPLWAQTEKLTLAAPESVASTTQWQVASINIDEMAPNIEVTLVSDQQKRFVWREVVTGVAGQVPDPGDPPLVTKADVLADIVVINRGAFRLLGKTLNQWLLDKINSLGVKIGTVTP